MELQQYDFKIQHRSGKTNANADALSRMYEEEEEPQVLNCYMMDITNLKPWKKARRINEEGSHIPISDQPYLTYNLVPNGYEADLEEFDDNSEEFNDPQIGSFRHDPECQCYLCGPPARTPSPFSCCGEIICRCTEEISSINTEKYQRAWEEVENESDYSFDDFREYNEMHSENIGKENEEQIAWTMCGMTLQDLEDMYAENIQVKQVIANQPINRGGSRCTENCDIENHHVHTYCRLCRKNLFYGTTIHDCIIGFSLGKTRPPMNPKYLINSPWWNEPEAVRQENYVYYMRWLERLYNGLPIYPITLEPSVVELD
jgi:hypothetical protein